MVGHLNGAKADRMMKADPKQGTPSYSQGYAPPPFNWTDRGQVFKTGQKVKVPAGTYENVLVTEEWALSEASGARQLKYYAPGVGNIKVGYAGNDEKKEMLDLVEGRAAQSPGDGRGACRGAEAGRAQLRLWLFDRKSTAPSAINCAWPPLLRYVVAAAHCPSRRLLAPGCDQRVAADRHLGICRLCFGLPPKHKRLHCASLVIELLRR